MTRVIQYSNENGSREGVYFTEDMDTPADDFIPHGCTLDSDATIDCEMPGSFPYDHNLERQ